MHFQWLSGQWIFPDLQRILGPVEGRVLDVGCAAKPYARWAPHAKQWFGIDVYDGPDVDAVVAPGESWPVADGSFDVVLCASMLSEVAELDELVAEVERVLAPGGVVVATVPFFFNEVKSTEYWRFTREGIRRLLGRRLVVLEATSRGGIGTVLGVLFLNWTETTMMLSRSLSIASMALLPVRLLLAVVVNTLAPLLDRLDRTGMFYGATLVVAQKPAGADRVTDHLA
ncbi:MAG: class I SAM-dependent methyltransferase [Solirubrobacteraceae bacterium]